MEPAHVYYESLVKGAMPFQTNTIPEKEWIKDENGWRRRTFLEKFGTGKDIKNWQGRTRSVLTALNENDPNFIYQLDVAMFYGAWRRAMGAEKVFLNRVFSLLYYGGLMYKDVRDGWQPWANTGIPAGSIVAHGGRILVQLPKVSRDADKHKFWNWVKGGEKGITLLSGLGNKFGTHGLSQASKPDEMCFGRSKYLTERHAGGLKKVTLAVSEFGHHYRYNIALGGFGNRNPWSGAFIDNSGGHGHFYMYYNPPTSESYGGFMIGCESEAPGLYGQTGHFHSWKGTSEEFASAGGRKWMVSESDRKKKGFLPMGTIQMASKYDATMIDLVGGGDQSDLDQLILRSKGFDMDWISRPPLPPVALTGGLGSREQQQKFKSVKDRWEERIKQGGRTTV
jgi:hypothetical protein